MKKRKLRKDLHICRVNLQSLINAEIYYYFLITILLMLLTILLNISNNAIIKNFLIFLFFFLLINLSLFEFLAVNIINHFSFFNRKISLTDAIQISLRKFKLLLKKSNLTGFLIALILILFIKIPIIVITIYCFKKNQLFLITFSKDALYLLLLLYIVVSYSVTKIKYVSYYMILENYSFKKALKKSTILSGNESLKDKLKPNIIHITSIIFYILITTFCRFIIENSYKFTQMPNTYVAFIISMSSIFFLVIFVTIVSLGSLFFIEESFYKHKKLIKENSKIISSPKKRNRTYKILKVCYYSFIIIGLLLTNILSLFIKNYDNTKTINHKVEVIGHRGASLVYPENTMASIYGAVELDADWIEIDVHQTRDKKIVLSHDNSLLRIANIDKNVTDMTYEQLKTVDVGSFFNSEYSSERIPLLEDVIKFAKKNNVKLNIEMKPVGNEESFEEEIVRIIKKYNYEKKCMISSFSYVELENIKKMDKNITTTYVMIPVIGTISKLEYADILSVEFNSITSKLVYDIHREGKEVNVWVANDEESIKKLINMNVDKITTDNIELTKEIVDNINENKTLQ